MKKIITVILSIGILSGCGNPDNQPNATIPNVEVAKNLPTGLIVAVGKVEPENEIVGLSAPSGGIVQTVIKKDGDSVSKGELLVQLDDVMEQNKINEIKAQIQSQQAQIDIEQTHVKETTFNLNNKLLLLDRTKRLVQTGAETQQSFDDLSTEVKVLEVSIERSKAAIQLAVNKLSELTAQLKTAETEVRKKQFKSPFDGVLLDMQLSKGEAINQFTSYAEFAPQGNLIVRAEVDELFSSGVKAGQPVEIVYTGSDKVIATGEVLLVSPYLKKKSLFSEKASDQEDRRVREIRIGLKDAGNLLINAKVECKIKP